MLEAISWVVYGALALVAIWFWWRRRSLPAAWLAASFGVLGLIVLQGVIVEPIEGTPAQFSPQELYTDAVIILLLGFPYLLHRFARSLRPDDNRAGLAADVGMALVVISVLASPAFPQDSEAFTSWQQFLQFALLGWWAVMLGAVSWSLWQAGRGRPGVVRRRMHLMSGASASMNLALVASFVLQSGGGSDTASTIVSQLFGWAAAIGFLLAFEPPQVLRRIWRAEEETALRHAEAGLVAAETAEQAAEAIIDAAAALVGGDYALITARDGRLLAKHGRRIDVAPEARTLRVERDEASVLVKTTALSPVFGEGEEALLHQLSGHLDLSLKRIVAFEESERARLQTERANAELSQLVYGVSHDLRNPLVTVLGFVKFLKAENAQLTENQQMALDRIAVSATYMEGLIDDLLQLSRIGRTDADVKPVDMAALAADIGSDIDARYADATVEVSGQGTAAINPTRARQLLTNLVDNAARHGGTSPLHITVTVQQPDRDTVEVTVADDGVGIPREHRERAFQIFQRLSRFDAETKGSGIGLTMCRRIVEDVGGTIAILDTDVGTTFRIRLPATTLDMAEEPAEPAVTSSQGSLA